MNSNATMNFGWRHCIVEDGVEELSMKPVWKRVSKFGEALDGFGIVVLASQECYQDFLYLSDCEVRNPMCYFC